MESEQSPKKIKCALKVSLALGCVDGRTPPTEVGLSIFSIFAPRKSALQKRILHVESCDHLEIEDKKKQNYWCFCELSF